MGNMRLQLLLSGASLCLGRVIEKHFDIGWVRRAPDGYERPVMGINGEWPCPVIEADLGDTVKITAKNSLGNQTTSLHFHGMWQQGSSAYDGGVGISQCAVQQGDEYKYEFKAEPAGTSWYHGHDRGQYPDGLRGMLIVHDREWEKSLCIDEQIFLTMSDWYQKEFHYIIKDYLSEDNKDGDIPAPDNFLFNESREGPDLKFDPGKRYLIRIASMSSLACGNFHISGHKLKVVGVDGVQTQSYETDTIKVCAGQRYDILVDGRENPQDEEFEWITQMDTDQLRKGKITPADARSVIGKVAYHGGNDKSYSWRAWSASWRRTLRKETRSKKKKLDSSWKPDSKKTLNDMKLKPLSNAKLLKDPTKKIVLKTNQTYYEGIGSRIATGSQPWSEPKVPSLFTALSSDYAHEASTYGPGVDPWVLKHNEIVQVYMENPHDHPHPMHIHGHSFQVVARGKGSWDGDESKLPAIPMTRDTVMIPKEGFIVLRFKADNPGIWFFHCHVDLHLVGGMASTFIEAPEELRKQKIPDKGFNLCEKMGRQTTGNCAGQGSCESISASEASSQCNNIWASSFSL